MTFDASPLTLMHEGYGATIRNRLLGALTAMPRASRPRFLASATLTDEEAFDAKCIRYRNRELARLGCGDPKCDTATCAVARHARLILRAFDALDAVPARPSASVPKDA